MNLNISRIDNSSLLELQALSIRTFEDAFAAVNTVANMRLYMDSAFNKDRLNQELMNPDSHFYFCRSGFETIGYMKVNFAPAQTDIHDDVSLEIERIYVLEEYQNLKAGAFLIDNAVKLALNHNLKYLWLGVWENNLRAIKFYGRNGFQEFSRHSFMLGNDHQIDIMMKRILSS
jgi:ribosomal protein S18 acetylase RimI-like enzyme